MDENSELRCGRCGSALVAVGDEAGARRSPIRRLAAMTDLTAWDPTVERPPDESLGRRRQPPDAVQTGSVEDVSARVLDVARSVLEDLDVEVVLERALARRA